MGGLSFETAYRWTEELIEQVRYIHQNCRRNYWSSARLGDEIRKIKNSPKYKKLPAWATGKIIGYDQAMDDEIRQYITHMHYYDGRFHLGPVPSQYLRQVADENTCILVWKDAPHKIWYAQMHELDPDDHDKETDILTHLALLSCTTCGQVGWVKLCRLCYAPLCGSPDCETDSSHGYAAPTCRDCGLGTI